MKNILIVIFILSGGYLVCAQNIGIGTIYPQKVLHIDAAKNNSLSAPPPPLRDTRYDDDVTIGNAGNVSIGNIAGITRLDIRSGNLQSPKDAIGIGNTSQAANVAGAGALKYYPVAPSSPDFANGKISYSDGSNWIDLQAKIPNDFVYATNSSAMNLLNNNNTKLMGWTKIEDVNESFDQTSGIFTAIKDGTYLVAFTFTSASAPLDPDARLEAVISTNSISSSTNKVFKCVNSFPGANVATAQATGQCSGIFNLTKGDNITVSVLNELGAAKTLDPDPSYTTLSIFGIQ